MVYLSLNELKSIFPLQLRIVLVFRHDQPQLCWCTEKTYWKHYDFIRIRFLKLLQLLIKRVLFLWFQTIVFRFEIHKIPDWKIFQKFVISMTLLFLLIPNLITKMCSLQYVLLFFHTQRIFILKYLQKQPLFNLSNSIRFTLPPNDI